MPDTLQFFQRYSSPHVSAGFSYFMHLNWGQIMNVHASTACWHL